MKIEPFALERYFARYEFTAPFLLSSSDCEALSMAELLSLADDESLKAWEALKLGYTESKGHPRLRESIAGLYETIQPDQMLVMAPQEGILLFMQALLNPGDHIVCTFPGYQSLYALAESIGCRVSRWLPEEDKGWFFDERQLERLLQDDTRVVVINFPHNPTGYLPTVASFRKMLSLVQRRGAWLLSDEMYRFLEIGGKPILPAGCDLYEKAFSLGGLSKAFGVTRLLFASGWWPRPAFY